MQRNTVMVNDERGSLLLVTMMILLLVTVIGLSAIRTSTGELKVAANDIAYKKAFYNADSGISYALMTNPSLEPPWPSMDPDATSNEIIAYTDAPFQLFYRRELDPGPPKRIELESRGDGTRASARIVVGIQLPVPPGALPGPGEEGVY